MAAPVSSMPAAIDAMVVLARVDPELVAAGVQVTDGPPVEDIDGDVIAIGLEPLDPEVRATWAIADLGSGQLEEYDVPCVARSWSGDLDFKPLRDTAMGLVAKFAALLKADQRLGGAVTRARVTDIGYLPLLIPVDENGAGGGAVVTTPFTVHVEAFR